MAAFTALPAPLYRRGSRLRGNDGKGGGGKDGRKGGGVPACAGMTDPSVDHHPIPGRGSRLRGNDGFRAAAPIPLILNLLKDGPSPPIQNKLPRQGNCILIRKIRSARLSRIFRRLNSPQRELAAGKHGSSRENLRSIRPIPARSRNRLQSNITKCNVDYAKSLICNCPDCPGFVVDKPFRAGYTGGKLDAARCDYRRKPDD